MLYARYYKPGPKINRLKEKWREESRHILFYVRKVRLKWTMRAAHNVGTPGLRKERTPIHVQQFQNRYFQQKKKWSDCCKLHQAVSRLVPTLGLLQQMHSFGKIPIAIYHIRMYPSFYEILVVYTSVYVLIYSFCSYIKQTWAEVQSVLQVVPRSPIPFRPCAEHGMIYFSSDLWIPYLRKYRPLSTFVNIRVHSAAKERGG